VLKGDDAPGAYLVTISCSLSFFLCAIPTMLSLYAFWKVRKLPNV
jgi:hypothetical protein